LSRQARLVLLVIVIIGLAVAVAWLPPLHQDSSYHDFADRRSLFGIPNAADVGSNLLILAAGLAGLARMWRSYRPADVESIRRLADRWLFGWWYLAAARAAGLAGLAQLWRSYRSADVETIRRLADRWLYGRWYLAAVLTALGSIYYHLVPDDHRLLWDRLPLALLFASFAAIMIAERINLHAGLLAGPPLLVLAVGSVLYWYAGETWDVGDLRPYLLLQLIVLLLTPLILLLFDSPHPGETGRWWALLLLYALAKGSEQLDHEIFSLGHLISGHTLKHLLAAWAIYMTVRIRAFREESPPPSCHDRPFVERV
jgi:hypothetical protein